MSTPHPTQKTNRRKRRRRQVSISSSSSDNSLSSDEEVEPVAKPATESMDVDGDSSSASSSSSSSESSSSEDSNSDSDSISISSTTKAPARSTSPATTKQRRRYSTNSPTPPPPITLPSFLDASQKISAIESQEEIERREKFKTVYMNKLVEGFGGELEKLRENDPAMGPKRLQLLIDSLAVGIDIYNDPKRSDDGGVDEVGLLLGSDS
ncbi:uncharacterized protein L203_104986 [Cryptococcus depauperatus CBS 7841]|uniref:Ribosome assembly protein 3 n=1 Tax=Cryptococcus depauperatus CBS 7841 TaxID=1295531 RepID=A0AAJ8JWL8_9TREE